MKESNFCNSYCETIIKYLCGNCSHKDIDGSQVSGNGHLYRSGVVQVRSTARSHLCIGMGVVVSDILTQSSVTPERPASCPTSLKKTGKGL